MSRKRELEDRFETKVSFERSVYEKLRQDAEDMGMSVSFLVRQAVDLVSKQDYDLIREQKRLLDRIAELERQAKLYQSKQESKNTIMDTPTLEKYIVQYAKYCEKVKPDELTKLSWATTRARYEGVSPKQLIRVLDAEILKRA